MDAIVTDGGTKRNAHWVSTCLEEEIPVGYVPVVGIKLKSY
jgi:hypothetical protein